MGNISVGIIGRGNIGSELYKKVISQKWDVKWTMNTQGFFKGLSNEKIGDTERYSSQIKGLDLVFLTIPTSDDGKIAFNYIETALDAKIPVVTCEKGALSNYYSELEEAINKGNVGYSATVGGGSRLLRYLGERVGSQIEEIHAVINGTLNYIFEELSNGKNLRNIVEETKRLGYAEPGARDPLEIINQEATGDVPKKTAILFNSCNLGSEKIVAKNIQSKEINLTQLKRLEKEAPNWRYIVSIIRNSGNGEMVIEGFEHQIENWHISAGFKHIETNSLFKKLKPLGVDNAILISEGESGKDGIYVLTGPGAGAAPTSLSMLIDAKKILL